MGENWLRRNGGGAVGVFSPTGLSANWISEGVVEEIFGAVFGPEKERGLVVPITNALTHLCTSPSLTEPCLFYALLGDPSLRLGIRSVAPPTDAEATGGNNQVALAWTDSTTPGVSYDVYRANAPHYLTYTKVNASPITDGAGPGTSYVDAGVTNTVTYRYYVVAIDADGFVSRWSNLNAACPAGDCLEVTPLNPNPPSVPTGVAVSDPGNGSQLAVSWAPNPELDVAFYTIHYGTEPGVYTSSIPVGKVTTARISGLPEGQVQFVALTATNTSGHTSGHSAEDSDFPAFAPGLHAPDFIDDLRVGLSGSDVVLTWSPVTVDVYGKPLAGAVTYEVWRGTTPQNLAPITVTAQPTWTHAGARNDGIAWHYRVRTIAADGTSSGIGAELPSMIVSLRVGRPPGAPGNVRLTWTPVTTTLDGTPIRLQHYAVYASPVPFRREDVGAMTPIATPASTSLDLTPPAGSRYYSVLAVDALGNVAPY
jgi:hypothetical protein